MSDPVIKFVNTFKKMLRTAQDRMSEKEIPDAWIRKFNFFADTRPESIVDGVGEILMTYRADIIAGDVNTFLNANFAGIMNKYTNDANLIMTMNTVLYSARQAWLKTPAKLQKQLIADIQLLLGYYCEAKATKLI